MGWYARLRHNPSIAEWDAAVLAALQKTEMLPRDVNGKVPPKLEIAFSPK